MQVRVHLSLIRRLPNKLPHHVRSGASERCAKILRCTDSVNATYRYHQQLLR